MKSIFENNFQVKVFVAILGRVKFRQNQHFLDEIGMDKEELEIWEIKSSKIKQQHLEQSQFWSL